MTARRQLRRIEPIVQDLIEMANVRITEASQLSAQRSRSRDAEFSKPLPRLSRRKEKMSVSKNLALGGGGSGVRWGGRRGD